MIMLNIRGMEKEDIQKISSAFIAQGWDGKNSVLEKYYVEQNNGKRFVFIADLNGEIAGYVTVMPKVKHGPFKNSGYPEVVDFNVFEKYQRQGIGNALLDAAENTAKEFSKVITLGVGLHHGYGAAQRMYVKRGYIPDGSGVWFENSRLNMGAQCFNNDSLILYLSKELD